MKKIALSFIMVALSISAWSQAQLSIGLKAGPNFASINTKENAGENYKNRTGFHAGAFALIKLTKIGIQPEVIFSQQGSTVTVNSKDFDANYSYINIPIMLKLYTIAGINIQAGPQFGFVASKKNELLDELDMDDPVKGTDFSIGLGLGWDLPFGLTVDGRYNLGLSDNNDLSGGESLKNQVWQFSLGYKFIKLGK
ncbi:MAG TPA: porin family protein [Ohtaekwangia sp.]|nr:porin family protein [Ohtaekwangia sp.]